MPVDRTNQSELYEPLRSVVVPTDLLEGSELALRRALLLPVARGAQLHVAHVLSAKLPEQQRLQAEAQARTAIGHAVANALAQVRVDHAAEVIPTVLSGSTYVEIIRYARSVGADLIVLGRHGRRPVRDKLIGTTASRIVRKGDMPILVVNVEPVEPYRRPMIAAALEDADGRTFEVALRVVGQSVTTIDVVHAVHVPFEGLVTPTSASAQHSEYRNAFVREADEELRGLVERYARAGVQWNTIRRVGEPREVVLAQALAAGSDLIALGTHGRTGLAHALLGSVAESILTAAPCDLLVSRPVRFSFQLP